MPKIRIEWVPVRLYGLGHLGFDHLHIVFEPGSGARQDDWFVMEGVRDPTPEGVYLGVDGADGRTTLATANLASSAALTAKIGLPEQRGSRALPFEGEEFRAWETMASYARAIEEEDFPYIAISLPASPTPTINSSSAVASLLHYAGLDPTQWLPFGLHMSPGTTTLLGTRFDDHMRIENGFTTLLGGRGDDVFEGGADRHRIDRFYGGEGDDIFRWSPGFNIVHGGQPLLPYSSDGTDVMDYSGAGRVTISYDHGFIAHRTPNYVAVFATGTDHLFSVERIQWNARTDEIVLGDGLNLLEDDRVVQPASRDAAEADDDADLRTGRLVLAAAGDIANAAPIDVPDWELDLHGPPPDVLDLAGTAIEWPDGAFAAGLF
jgi:hypothetical protein